MKVLIYVYIFSQDVIKIHVILFKSIRIELNYKEDEKRKQKKDDSIELAIITKANFISFFERLREWKTHKGIPSRTFDFDSIMTTSIGRDSQENFATS